MAAQKLVPNSSSSPFQAPGGLLTNAEAAEDQRSATERGSTPVAGRGPATPVSAPTNSHSRSVKAIATPSLPPPSAVETSPVIVRPEEGSVKDLEAAMTRHLPEDAPDFSTDALLRGGSGVGGGGHRSTIQWVGGTGGQQNALPASTLLRQLYANRESVIRTSVQRSYYPEVQAALPTPPGHEGYQEGMFAKAHDFASYNSSSTPNGGGIGMPSGGVYTDYHSAMTPPSSVSPREKMAGECGDLRGPSSYLSESSGSLPAQPLPLKPQVYSYGPSLESSSYSSTLTADQASSLYSHSGFHLYHSNPSKTAGPYDSLRAGASWYSPSS